MKLADLQLNREQTGGMSPFYVSFSDLMVLLCVFFVMLLGMSKIETGSFERLKAGFSGTQKGTLMELATNLKKIAAKEKGISVRMASDGVRLDLESAALFSTGSSVLKPGSLTRMRKVLRTIRATPYKIDIEGHSDDVPFYRKEEGEVQTNWSLSGRRASSVVNYLIDFGFSESRLRIIGYAATQPKSKISGKTGRILNKARAKNRRVSLLVR